MAANPVNENLNSWQPDAATNDTNLPTATDPAGIGESQDLSGNLRLIKSVVRQLGSAMSFEYWKGIKNLAGSQNIAFTYVNGTTFTVNDNFSSSGRGVAVLHRRVLATITGSFILGTITAVSWSSPNTTITVAWDGGASINNTLADVNFGPNPTALALYQLLGVPYNTIITNAGFVWNAFGLAKVRFQDLAGNPDALGELARSGDLLLYHDGSNINRIYYGLMNRKSGDQTINNGVYANIADFSMPIGANEIILLSYALRCSMADGFGPIGFKVNGPSGAGGWYGIHGGIDGSSSPVAFVSMSGGTALVNSGTALTSGPVGGGGAVLVLIKAILVNGANAGQIEMQFANVGALSAATVHDSSWVEAKRFA